MRKHICSTLIMTAAVITSPAQTISQLWQEADAANKKDQPKTEITALQKIIKMAETKHLYGSLMKAELRQAQAKVAISPDSLMPAVERLEERMKTSKDEKQRTVYSAVLSKIYKTNGHLSDSAEVIARRYANTALENPAMLAAAKASEYSEIIIKEAESEIFGHDLLSVIGFSLDEYEAMHDYYEKIGNRPAACITAKYMVTNGDYKDRGAALDSLLTVYGDIDAAGCVAIDRYNCLDGTQKEKIDFVRNAVSRWGNWPEMNQLRMEELRLINPQFNVVVCNASVIPDTPQTARLNNMRNIKTLTMKIYKLGVNGDTQLRPSNKNDLAKLCKVATLLTDKTVTHNPLMENGTPYPEYELHDDSIMIGALPVGVYMLEFSAGSDMTQYALYHVSNVMCIGQANQTKRQRYAVVNATTGQPLPGAKINVYGWKSGARYVKTTLTCNDKGEVCYNANGDESGMVYAYTNDDKASADCAVTGSYYYRNMTQPTTNTVVMTDRSIYRPGQIVKMAAVVYENKNNVENSAVAGKTVTAVLRDANYKVMAEKSLVTDEYGKVEAEFALPSDALNGTFTLNVNGKRASLRVEEYKRPTFIVEFDEIATSYKMGDTVTVKGRVKSYAGIPVQGAGVKYTQTLKQPFWWRMSSRYLQSGIASHGIDGTPLTSGKATTDDDGAFTIAVPIVSPAEINEIRTMFCNIEVKADVTDAAGETHNAITSLPIPVKEGVLTSDLGTEYVADSLRAVTFSYLNALGKNVEKSMKWRIGDGNWQTATTDGRSIDLTKTVKALKSGRHTLTAVCEGDTLKQEFMIFRFTDKVPAENTRSFFYQSGERFTADGKPVTIMMGSSDSDVHIFYSIVSGNGDSGAILEESASDISNQYLTRNFNYRPEYGNGLTVSVVWVKNGECYSHVYKIERPAPDNRLQMEWTTFRDRLVPGQKEEWTLSVKRSDGTPADAQLMATMYDKSLDQLSTYGATFVPMIRTALPETRWRTAWSDRIYAYSAKQMADMQMKYFQFSRFDIKLFDMLQTTMFYSRQEIAAPRRISVRGTSVMSTSDEIAAAPQAKYNMALMKSESKEMATGGLNAVKETEAEAGAGEEQSQQMQIRENLNETAFFYPALQTDKDGNITMRFTLPEALTTWRFLGIAHTKDIATGMLTGEAVAQKDVMVQPNMPRFVRMGDKVQIQARITNASESMKSGKAVMQLIDPATEQTLLSTSTDFSAEAGKTTVATFDYAPDGNAPLLLVCRITAQGDGFSDGEQHYLPVLPDKEMVTKTVTFTQIEAGTKSIDIAKMFDTNDKARLTVEYTDNPAWMVIQALPQTGTPHDDCSVCQAASLYANTLGQYIAGKVPALKSLTEQWNREQGTETTLMSNLDKNGSLKDIMLNETPWMNDADSEAEQRRMLATFFDENTIAGRKASAIEKLGKLQKADGSWSWMPGMAGSAYMTTNVADMLVRLNTMAGTQSVMRPMLDKALQWLDREAVREVAEMKKQQKKSKSKPVFPSHRMLQYIYLRSLDNSNIKTDAQEAISYLIPLMKNEIKNQTMYEKAMTAIILQKRGETAGAREYVKSIKEYTVYKDDMGRYFDTQRASYSWRDYRIPTQAMAIMALQAVTPDDRQTVSEMQRWLLQEKRTQTWDTPLNAVDAIYSFLCDNSLTAGTEPAEIAIDGKPLEMTEATAGINYRRAVINNDIGRTLTVGKTGNTTSWGSVYAQFMQPAADVSAAGTELSVKREIFVADGDKKEVAGNGGTLSVGDRITVRITITADRDLDFVQVTDRRAACMEPVSQLSSYHNGYYEMKKDNCTNYYFDRMAKGKHVVETEYYIDRAGTYNMGTVKAECAYAPEFRAVAGGKEFKVK